MWKVYEELGYSNSLVHHRTIRKSADPGIWAFGQFFNDRRDLDGFRKMHFVDVKEAKKQSQHQQPFGGGGGGGGGGGSYGGYGGCCTCQQGAAGPPGPPGMIKIEA